MTGIEKIDIQQMEITEWINHALGKQSRATVMEKVSFLLNYVSIHFDTEEHYMEAFDYLDLDEHKKVHRAFRENILNILEEFSIQGEVGEILDKIYDQAIPWIIEHCQTFDQKMATFLRSVN